VAVSNKFNLDLCLDYNVAGFPNSINGLWAFIDISQGDYISFLYAARAYNLYRVVDKLAITDVTDALPRWNILKMRSGRTYYFPFRVLLRPIREFEASLVRMEFSYVAENLLLRGGYAKTHFQADQTTLQYVSQIGKLSKSEESVEIDLRSYGHFEPELTVNKELVDWFRVYPLREVIIQALIKKTVSKSNNLKRILETLAVDDVSVDEWEVLGEKALPEGHIDILIKERVPLGKSRFIIVEVKKGKAGKGELNQVIKYKSEFGDECIGSCIIAKEFTKTVLSSKEIVCIPYSLDIDPSKTYTFNDLLGYLKLST